MFSPRFWYTGYRALNGVTSTRTRRGRSSCKTLRRAKQSAMLGFTSTGTPACQLSAIQELDQPSEYHGDFPGDERAATLVQAENSTESVLEYEQLPIFDTIALSMGTCHVDPSHSPRQHPFQDYSSVMADTQDLLLRCTQDTQRRLQEPNLWGLQHGHPAEVVREAQRGARTYLPHRLGDKEKINVVDNYDMTSTDYAKNMTHYEWEIRFMDFTRSRQGQ
ncbi:hypothetical protein BC938DRAFT_481553 [Jimgerdemannia flammicorona]|uniref:Uncharacterized protein n=1 Tax=Jimgerdemannia flammicorona TaxID=994334 RepID=A0A433QG21_9FUNG|nr:hypothetical protein BC938DRAFT_481553 [Jimgerdemannia flammicorona]